jgi:16S rRNA (adenine1518-N6/adenine1519-N6)-dimethyltransferase
MNLARYEEPPVMCRDKDLLFRVIRASFGQRRKKLVNGVSSGAGLEYTKEEVAEALAAAGLSPDVRGEALTLAEFAALTDALPCK